jgi:endonuclease YncB( thermonuclease family)
MRTPRQVFFAAFLIGVVTLVLLIRQFFVSYIVVDRPDPSLPPPPVAAVGAPVTASTQNTAQPAASDPRSVRDVTPDGVTRVYATPATAAVVEAKRPRDMPMRITQGGVTPDGLIVWTDGSVRLYGIAFPANGRICTSASGERWPCGRRAYIALHNKVASATVECASREASNPPAANCFVGKTNLAVWLLNQGFVSVAPGVTEPELIAAEAAAKTGKLGIWSDPHGSIAAVPPQVP